MTPGSDFISRLSIVGIWYAVGGSPLRGRDGRAFWRNGDGWCVRIDPDKNVWYDHRDGRGGGILDLIQTALRCDRAQAIEWCRDYAGVPRREWTPQEKRDWARRKVAAQHEASELVAWRQRMTDMLQHYHNLHLDLYHCCIRRILRGHYADDQELVALMDEADRAEAAWQHAEAALDAWRAASWTDVLVLFRQQRRRAA